MFMKRAGARTHDNVAERANLAHFAPPSAKRRGAEEKPTRRTATKTRRTATSGRLPRQSENEEIRKLCREMSREMLEMDRGANVWASRLRDALARPSSFEGLGYRRGTKLHHR